MTAAVTIPEKAREDTIPPLEAGDRLTRDEFERRYHAMPHIKKAELIKGVVYMPSPVRHKQHSKPHGCIMTWLGVYHAATPLTDFGDNVTVRLGLDDEPQPDAFLRLESAVGGTSIVTPDDYIEGPPELIAEIAASSASYDMHDKLDEYQLNGVQEYVVWQIYDQRIDWFSLESGTYQPLSADEKSVIRSRVFPGLHLHIAALLQEDLAAVLAELQKGLETAEHAAFVQRLTKQDG